MTDNLSSAGDPLNDPAVDLNEFTIQGLLGAFLKANPENRAFQLKAFRAKQFVERLVDTNSIFSTKSGVGGGGSHQHEFDTNMMENVCCLFILCMHLATLPNIESPASVFGPAAVVYSVLAESLAVMQSDKTTQKVDIAHPSHILSPIDRPRPLSSFRSALKVARSILRDATRGIREARETQNSQPALNSASKTAPPIDCWQPHSIYFMCVMGATHLAGVLKRLGNLNAVPGTMETLVLVACIVPRSETNDKDEAALRKPAHGYLKVHKEEESRFQECMSISRNLGISLAAHTLDNRSMQELRIARSHMARYIEHADAEYARIKCSTFRTDFLGIVSGGSNHRSSSKDTASTLHDKTNSNWPGEECILTGNLVPTWSFQNPTLPQIADAFSLVKSNAKTETGAKNIKDSVNSKNSRSSKINKRPADEEKTKYAEARETKFYWSMLNKNLRVCYLCTRPLRQKETASLFYRRDYMPGLTVEFDDYDFYAANLSGKILSAASTEIEGLNFYAESRFPHVCPPQNDPSRSIYWATTSIIEWLHQETMAGRGLNQTAGALASSLKKELVQIMSLPELTSIPHAPPKASPLGVGDQRNKSKMPIIARSSSAENRKLSLVDKLIRVANTARIEAQINSLHSGMNTKSAFDGKESRLKKTDQTLQHGMKTLRSISEAQSDLYREQYDELDDDDDDEGQEKEEDAAVEEYQHDDVDDVLSEHSGGSRHASSSSRRGGDPLSHLLASPLVGDINKFRRGLKLTGLVAQADGKNLGESMSRSVSCIWSLTLEEDDEQTAAAGIAKSFRKDKASFEAQSKRIAEEVLRYQKDKAEEDEAFHRGMEDAQHMEVSKSRAAKLSDLQALRESKRQESLLAARIKQQKLEDENALAKRQAVTKRALRKKLEEENAMEVSRLRDTQRFEEGGRLVAEQERNLREVEERERLRVMADTKEYSEILRRVSEEARMKYLEERRRVADQKQLLKEEGGRIDLERRRQEFLADRKKVQARVRLGNFRKHTETGKLGFYDDVRENPVEWVQYEDESGVPYYFDPILNKTTYETPTDASWRHYTVDEKIAYDAIHGEGAYDLLKWNERNRESINQFGGYYDEDGHWLKVNGCYIDDVFYDLTLGFFDEWGRYVLRPLVTDDLSFMV